MPFTVPLADAKASFPQYTFVTPLTPSAQKCAFHVRDEQGHDLCLKIIAPNYERDRLEREIQALQTINHLNVVRLKEYTFSSKSNEPARHYLVEEFVQGRDLAVDLIPGQPWQIARIVGFFAQLCDGLQALKQKGIVHRDLKPQNIRTNENGNPVIIDFGLCRHLNLPDLTNTLQGAQIGTPIYFAPEQFDGTKRDIDHRTDLFAVGILVYQTLTGEHPFVKPSMTTLAELRDAVCEGREYLARGAFVALEGKWRTVVGRLLEKERANRPADAAQVATILRRLGG
jgi:eukaryotic-like serine/threonine-protein kinase